MVPFPQRILSSAKSTTLLLLLFKFVSFKEFSIHLISNFVLLHAQFSSCYLFLSNCSFRAPWNHMWLPSFSAQGKEVTISAYKSHQNQAGMKAQSSRDDQTALFGAPWNFLWFPDERNHSLGSIWGYLFSVASLFLQLRLLGREPPFRLWRLTLTSPS